MHRTYYYPEAWNIVKAVQKYFKTPEKFTKCSWNVLTADVKIIAEILQIHFVNDVSDIKCFWNNSQKYSGNVLKIFCSSRVILFLFVFEKKGNEQSFSIYIQKEIKIFTNRYTTHSYIFSYYILIRSLKKSLRQI